VGARVAATLWRSFAEPSYYLPGGEIQAPTLVVWGTGDPILPPSVARATQAAIPGSRLELLDTGHVVFASDPAAFLAVAMPFLDAVTAQQQGKPATWQRG
jgi:pimeloyl-ACP methyl ester carboxylesterase